MGKYHGARDALQYQHVVEQFRALTNHRHTTSMRCCVRVRGRDDAPECCYQIVDGIDEPTFTPAEVVIMWTLGLPPNALKAREDGMWVLNRADWTTKSLSESLHDGLLANSLECASHPTRPIVDEGVVTGVVVIDACNGRLAMEFYRRNASLLNDLWSEVVDLIGIKPYYGRRGSLKPGWMVL